MSFAHNEEAEMDFRLLKRTLGGSALATAVVAIGIAGAHGAGCEVANKIDPASLVPPGIVGSGPFGEKPSTIDSVKLSDEQAQKAKAGKFKVGVVMQTMDIDWSKLVVAGITDTLKKYGAELVGVTNPNFQVDKQIAQIGDMIQLKP
ncbi:MAG: hypothetical protein FJX52_13770, partial [Alphaproteobacteria bacterium]|nr:hypothetical protein [Alphaproteobacteria bacterium]